MIFAFKMDFDALCVECTSAGNLNATILEIVKAKVSRTADVRAGGPDSRPSLPRPLIMQDAGHSLSLLRAAPRNLTTNYTSAAHPKWKHFPNFGLPLGGHASSFRFSAHPLFTFGDSQLCNEQALSTRIIPAISVSDLSYFTPTDSSLDALHFCFWLGFDRVKRSAANSRKPAGVAAPSTASRRFPPFCGRTVTLIGSESKDFRSNVSRAIDWCI